MAKRRERRRERRRPEETGRAKALADRAESVAERAESVAEESGADERRTERGPVLAKLFGEGGSFWGAVARIGTLVGVLTGIVSLFVVLRGEFSPDPPPEKAVTLGELALERRTWGQYLDEKEARRDPYSKAQLQRRGMYVQFHVEIVGWQGERLPLRWQLLDGDGDIVHQDKLIEIEPEVNTDSADLDFWVELPKRKGPFRIRVRLYEPDGVVALRRRDSDPFPGLGA